MNPLSGVFGEAWALYRAHWRHLALIALFVYLIVAALGILLVALLGLLGILLSGLVSIAGAFWLQGTLVEAVRDVRDGRADLSVRETFERVLPLFNRVVVAGLLLGFAVGIGIFLFVVPGLVVLTFFLFVVPAIVLENCGIADSFARSRALVRGHAWQVFGVIVLTFLLLLATGLALGLLLTPLEDWLANFLSQVVGNTLVAPFVVAVWTLAYYRLRAPEG